MQMDLPPTAPQVKRSRSEGVTLAGATPPPLQRQTSAPAALASAVSLEELDMLVQRLAALSSCPALIAIARQHGSEGGGGEPAYRAEDDVDEVDAWRPFHKTASRVPKQGPSGRRPSAVAMTQKFAGTAPSNRTRNAALATRRRVTVGPQTHHLIMPEKAPHRRFEQREWANAAKFRQGKAGLRLAPLDESVDDLPEQPRRFVPGPGSLPEDSEVDLDRIAALPEVILQHIARYHREARASMQAAAEEEEKAQRARKATRRPAQRYLSYRGLAAYTAQQARIDQAYRVQRRTK